MARIGRQAISRLWAKIHGGLVGPAYLWSMSFLAMTCEKSGVNSKKQPSPRFAKIRPIKAIQKRRFRVDFGQYINPVATV
ncbi:hypothetical protein SAMN05443248_5801 [Bradyrhizobium erythrophlei]|uniref:Uncharacterized protein n=1 Tax=Bradyrhizobium erythrophlei TaxID=1437360 RepID=A0A1M5V6W5_9BRAD|nr:hypothetical protein SAMN05443248_5801 [Bradyrhizobium erythrophlei]